MGFEVGGQFGQHVSFGEAVRGAAAAPASAQTAQLCQIESPSSPIAGSPACASSLRTARHQPQGLGRNDSAATHGKAIFLL
jgi:hypothetical protein